MAALSSIPDDSSRKTVSLIFQRLASAGQVTVAQALGVSEATVSRMKEEVPRLSAMLSVLELKVVPADMRCYDEKTLTAVLELARQRMAQIQTPQQLVWGDDK